MGKILVADDERGILDLMERVLGRRGHEVETFADGASAIEAIETGEYDVVISDLRMPARGGLDVLAAAKRRRAGLPVILISGSLEPEDRAQAELLGVYTMLHKPVDLAYLMTIVESAMGGVPSNSPKESAAAAATAPAAAPAATGGANGAGVLVRVVEREACLANLIGYCLRKQGYRVTGAAGEEVAIAIVGAPGAVEGVRKEAPKAVILALHAAGDLEQSIEVLDAGADVALPRPFEPDVLFAHVRAAARRCAAPLPPPAPAARPGPTGDGEKTEPSARSVTRNRMVAVKN
jgi:DNA-binding response OmpR family regulator